MAYASGSLLSDPVSLLNQVRLFCVANGFTEHRWVSSGMTTATQLILSKNNIYYCFWIYYHSTGSTELGTESLYNINMRLATGYSAVEEAWNQPGTWNEGGSLLDRSECAVCSCIGSGVIDKYHIFLVGNELTVAFKNYLNWWRWFGFGEVNKTCTFTGGGYVAGNYFMPNVCYVSDSTAHHYLLDRGIGVIGGMHCGGVFRCDIDATPQYHHGGGNKFLGTSYGGDPTGGDCGHGYVFKPNGGSTSGIPALYLAGNHQRHFANNYGLNSLAETVSLLVHRQVDRSMPVATLGSILWTSVELLAEEEEVSLNGKTYLAFPCFKKSPYQNTFNQFGIRTEPTSWHHGILIEKVV